MPDLIDQIEAKLGPLSGNQVLVLRGTRFVGDDADNPGEVLLRELLRLAEDRGLEGMAAEHVPLIVVLEEDASIELLDEADMNAHGWYRSATAAHTRQEDTAHGNRESGVGWAKRPGDDPPPGAYS